MKTIITTAVCSSLLLLAGCNDKPAKDEQITTKAVTPMVQNEALTSGINQANIDYSVRPQDNFYQYINGGWIKSHDIPDDKTAIGSFYDLRDKADNDVKAIIEELAAVKDLKKGTDEQKVADLFRSFMNTDKLNNLGTTPLNAIFADINKLANKHDLATFLGQSQATGIGGPLAFYIDVDAKNSNRYATHLWQSGLGLPDRDYYFNKAERFVKLRDGYVKHIAKMFNIAGLANGEQAAKTIMAIETKLAKYHWTRVQTRDSEKRYNKFATDKLNSLSDAFDWDAFLAGIGISQQKDIIINQPDYVQGFGKIYAETSLKDWQTYLTFHALSSFASYLTADLDNEDFDF